jgi:hypothetical protein
MEDEDRDERVRRTYIARTPLEEWFIILDWFKKITKSGLGLQGTQWPAYIHGRLCYQ